MSTPSNANETCVGPSSDNAGKASSCDGCPNQSACASGANKQPEIVGLDKLSQVKHIILVLSGKGGVGKSTVSAQIAFTLASMNKQVGLLDVDICGPSIPRMLGLVGHEVHQSASGWSPVYVEDNLGVMSIGFMLPSNDDAIIWRGPRKNGLIKQFLTDVDWGQLDYLIIDTPPGTSDEHISIVQYLKSANVDGAIIVTTPQEVAMADVRKEINFCKKTGINILGLVENMSGISLPLSQLLIPSSNMRLTNSRGEDMTDSVLLRIKEVCPELLELNLTTSFFTTSDAIAPSNILLSTPTSNSANLQDDNFNNSNTPYNMSKKFQIPYLGKIPMDSNMTRACEDGYSFLELYPNSVASEPFRQIITQIIERTEGGVTSK